MASEGGRLIFSFQGRYAGGRKGHGDAITALGHAGGCSLGDSACLSPQLLQKQESRGLICSMEDFT